ncbi:MAG: hypothetical protein IJN54_11645 [Lachnospiraceae bacterium]|nr:hypothetical protein [Lachnospiraceae bacterium]
MKNLYFIMDEFLKVEYDIKALLTVLAIMEGGCGEEKEEVKRIINVLEGYLKSVEEEVHTAIGSLDRFVVEDGRKCR